MREKLFALIMLGVFLVGCGGGSSNGGESSSLLNAHGAPVLNNASSALIVSKKILANSGGVINVVDAKSLVNDTTLLIPANALENDLIITTNRVDDVPALSFGLNFIGTPLDFGPSGTIFSKPATLKISFTEKELDFAGVGDKNNLKLYSFGENIGVWSQEKITSIDVVNNVVTGEVNHFSFYALIGITASSPQDLGTPQPGDILFMMQKYPHSDDAGWIPGHVRIFTGEEIYTGDGKNVSADVVRCGKYNIVEALWSGVQYSYYKIPNVTNSCADAPSIEDDGVYMGAREPKNFTLTNDQRIKIVEFAKAQIGKPYVKGKTIGVLFGLLEGIFVKGPDGYNCVGLVEAAYEYAGTNYLQGSPQGIITYDDGDIISPAMQYSRTKPATGISDTLPGGGSGWHEIVPEN